MKRLLAVFAAVFAVAAVATPAFASSGPSENTTINGSASVAETIGWSVTPSDISFGELTPGNQGTATESYSVLSNDAAGVTISVTAGGTWTASTGSSDTSFADHATLTQSTDTLPAASTTWNSDPFTEYQGSWTGDQPAVIANVNGNQQPVAATETGTASGSSDVIPFSDTFGLTLPAGDFYPGSFTDTFTYTVLSQ